ncbi:MAG: hypothetical protein JWR24_3459 [Actinoallomurus sp.]|nr:hypothetical protein [Actinoallomurus sp.]
MLKKTIAAGGLLITTAAGALVTCTPAFAEASVVGHSQTHLVSNKNKNRNWNGTENESFNHIRLRIHNRNNNVAVARVQPSRRQRPVIVTPENERAEP